LSSAGEEEDEEEIISLAQADQDIFIKTKQGVTVAVEALDLQPECEHR
jgi:hypothetical protein